MTLHYGKIVVPTKERLKILLLNSYSRIHDGQQCRCDDTIKYAQVVVFEKLAGACLSLAYMDYGYSS